MVLIASHMVFIKLWRFNSGVWVLIFFVHGFWLLTATLLLSYSVPFFSFSPTSPLTFKITIEWILLWVQYFSRENNPCLVLNNIEEKTTNKKKRIPQRINPLLGCIIKKMERREEKDREKKKTEFTIQFSWPISRGNGLKTLNKPTDFSNPSGYPFFSLIAVLVNDCYLSYA